MRKTAIIVIGALIILQIMPLIYAEPLITGIFYDPEGVDTGFEWIELYNPTNDSINLANYALFKGNGDKESDWSALPQIAGTIHPNSFFLIGEVNVSGSDLTIKLALFNGPDSIALKSSDNETVDLVGYGPQAFSEYSLGNPTVDAASGKALTRRFTQENDVYHFLQTDNNSQDWQTAGQNPRNSLYQYVAPLIQNTSVTLVVPQMPTIIQNITLSDDQPSKQGVQWSLAGKKRLELRLQDESSAFNTSQLQVILIKNGVSRVLPLQILSIENSSESDIQNEVIVEIATQLTSDLFSGNYSLQVNVENSDDNILSFTREIELLPSIGMVVCDDMTFVKSNNAEYVGKCLIHNVGNVAAYFGLNLTFDSGFLVNPYLKHNESFTLLSDAALLLGAGEQLEVEIVTNISRLIKFGEYSGTLQVRAWAIN